MKIEPYWYLASYPKSGNTWCRIFLSDLHSLISKNKNINKDYELNLKNDLLTGEIISSRSWLDDQFGFDSSDLDFDSHSSGRDWLFYSLYEDPIKISNRLSKARVVNDSIMLYFPIIFP